MKKPIKLLLFIPDLGFGGAQRQLIELVCALNDEYPSICIIVCSIINDQRLVDAEILGSVKFLSLNKKNGILFNLPAFLKFVKIIRDESPDVIHAFLGRAIRFSMLARLFASEQKLVISFRNAISSPQKLFGSERLNFHLFFKFVVHASTFNSKEALENAIYLLGYSSKISHFIPNGVNVSRFQPAQTKLSETPVVLLLPARIIYQKNQLGLIDAVDLLVKRNSHFFGKIKIQFVGAIGDMDYWEQVQQKISEMKLESCFDYIGEKKDIITYYHNAHAVILPSFHEGFPNVLLEAWACAKPVLVSDEADTASLLTKGHGGINFPAHSTEQMADAIESFIRLSSDQKQYQGKIGYQIIKKHYKFSKIAKAYAQLYYNLLEQK